MFEILEGATTNVLRRPNRESCGTNAVDMLEEKLQKSSQADLRSVRVRFDDGVVRLSGHVASFHAKQIAQILVRHECAADSIENSIDVV